MDAKMNVEQAKIETLILDPNNTRLHSERNIKELERSVSEFGQHRAAVVQRGSNKVLIGNGMIQAMRNLGWTECAVLYVDDDDATAIRRAISDNRISDLSTFDDDLLATMMAELGEGVVLPGFTDDEIAKTLKGLEDSFNEGLNFDSSKNLLSKFLVPPFSVFDTRQGYWQSRKSFWKELIKDKGETRENTLYKKSKSNSPSKMKVHEIGTVSILDPVLAEIALDWFCVPEGKTFDTFAGDTVFGFVSGYKGHPFTGIELRKEQAEANQLRCSELGLQSRYICDDGQNVLKHFEPNSMDLLFSCPPYFNLEKYSDLPNDASNQDSFEDFMKILDNAFSGAIKCLKDNRFAVIVVGDVRDKQNGGRYLRFPDAVKDVFERNGMILYNEIILVIQVGSASLRGSKYMEKRKVAKVHQNVLVFYKGDPNDIKNEFPSIETLRGDEFDDVNRESALDVDEGDGPWEEAEESPTGL